MPDNTTRQLVGFSLGLKTDVVVFDLNQGDTVTLSHELLHSLDVPHTFDKTSPESLYVYQGFNTENIMDYDGPATSRLFNLLFFKSKETDNLMDYLVPIKRNTYKWHWQIARDSVDKYNLQR